MRTLAIGVLALVGTFPAMAAGPTSVAEQVAFLREAKVVKSEPIAVGVTGSRRLTLELDGYRHDAHFQVVNQRPGVVRTTGRMELGLEDSWRHNVAAFLLDDHIGLGAVPAAVERTIAGKRGALSWWVDDKLMTVKDQIDQGIAAPRAREWAEQMSVMAIWDQLIDNADRNQGNVVIDQRWQIWLIDHTRAFGTSSELRQPEKVQRCGRRVLAAIRTLERESLRDVLKSHLSDVRIDALLARRDKIVAALEQRIAATAEEAVLFDYTGER